ncbi:GNAT family N-acetyltransferase [Alkalihalobacterium sp. APHAB7]|uniref:GNAT family N-acetyltransferase n=1 Tax=Alkalihalobacterium sp. APHAB7 TaxID=3402081 RepID=UPI003AB0D22D
MSIVIRIAEAKDLLPIQRLVAKAGLTEEGIEKRLDHFLVVETDEKEIVGTVGIEPIGNDGLLRSLVIKSEHWNAKIGLDFLEIALAYAKQKELDQLYLITHRSLEFFEYLGFKIIEDEHIPEHVENSPHFGQYVKGVTKLMALDLQTEDKAE